MKNSLVQAALVTAVAAVFTTGCAGSGTNSAGNTASAPSTDVSARQHTHNRADVTFVQRMIPHHEGAIDMARRAEEQTDNAEIRDLARRIEQAQGPEIEQLNNWLDAWGIDHNGAHDDKGGGGEMAGMSGEDMQKLGSATGAEFDRLFLELMIEHHRGAIDMSDTVLDEGSNPEVKALAQRIIDVQHAEITEMRSLLES